jgi:hypothetical protein
MCVCVCVCVCVYVFLYVSFPDLLQNYIEIMPLLAFIPSVSIYRDIMYHTQSYH